MEAINLTPEDGQEFTVCLAQVINSLDGDTSFAGRIARDALIRQQAAFRDAGFGLVRRLPTEDQDVQLLMSMDNLLAAVETGAKLRCDWARSEVARLEAEGIDADEAKAEASRMQQAFLRICAFEA